MKKDTLIRSGHVCLADYNSKNNNIVLEKFFELENWFCQSCIGLESNIALLGKHNLNILLPPSQNRHKILIMKIDYLIQINFLFSINYVNLLKS